jgi:hypothetical protein
MIDCSFYCTNVEHATLLATDDSLFNNMFFSIESIIWRLFSSSSWQKEVIFIRKKSFIFWINYRIYCSLICALLREHFKQFSLSNYNINETSTFVNILVQKLEVFSKTLFYRNVSMIKFWFERRKLDNYSQHKIRKVFR